jgi:hypothetical protein
MTKITGTPIRTVRMDDSLWNRFGEFSEDRSATIRAWIHWYVGDEGWPAPSRSVEPVTEPDPPQSRA